MQTCPNACFKRVFTQEMRLMRNYHETCHMCLKTRKKRQSDDILNTHLAKTHPHLYIHTSHSGVFLGFNVHGIGKRGFVWSLTKNELVERDYLVQRFICGGVTHRPFKIMCLNVFTNCLQDHVFKCFGQTITFIFSFLCLCSDQSFRLIKA